jgi:hypothetical protein
MPGRLLCGKYFRRHAGLPVQENRKVARSSGFSRFEYRDFRLKAGLRTLDPGLCSSPACP